MHSAEPPGQATRSNNRLEYFKKRSFPPEKPGAVNDRQRRCRKEAGRLFHLMIAQLFPPCKSFFQSSRLPSTEMVATCQGMHLPLACMARCTAITSPPQQGTSMRTTVMLRMSFRRRISASFSL